MLTKPRRGFNAKLAARPRPTNLDEYATAAEEIEGLLSELPGIVAIYRTGSVSVPGISDLDRIAVVEGRQPVPGIWSRLSEGSRYLAMHGPFLVDVATFRRHRWFAFIEPLSLSSGDAVELEGRPLPEFSEPLIGAESLVVCLLRVLKEVSTGRLKVRPLLCGLNNVRHALNLARLSQPDTPAAWRIVEDVTNLRRSWFTSPESQRAGLVRDIAMRTTPALLEALWVLGERTESAEEAPASIRLGPPLPNVTLVPSGGRTEAPRRVPQLRLPLVNSAKISEMRWRISRPQIPLHPVVLALLAGSVRTEHRPFRSERREIVRAYDTFLAAHRASYSGIGFASLFVGT